MPSHQRPLILFTHIPKTAGTSFKESVIFPNINREATYKFRGYRDLIKNRLDIHTCDFIEGHYSYGIHRFLPKGRPYKYITVLRDPLDHAISYYYFIRQCNTPAYKHPALKDALDSSIARFYSRGKYQNLQTQFVLGYPLNLCLRITLPISIKSYILKKAKERLAKKYDFVGIFEDLSNFQENVACEMDWINLNVHDQTKTTRSRPRPNEINRDEEREIRRHNCLDFELYNFACSLRNHKLSLAI